MSDFNDIDPEVVKKLREKPSLFVEEIIGVEPYEWQKEFLDNQNERKAVVAGRQVGKSTAISWLALHRFTMFPDHNVLIVSPTQRQAVELFHRKLKSEIPEWLDNPEQYGLRYVAKTEIEGTNGSRMKAMPAANKGETIRGFTGDTVIVDEAAFIEEEVFTSVLAPMLATTDGDFVLAGTPWGEAGYLYKKFHSERWDEWQVASMENPDISPDFIEEQKEQLTKSEYKREILGQFASKGNAAIPEELWKKCLYRGNRTRTLPSDEIEYPPKTMGECYLGVDVATGGKSKAVFTSMDEGGNVFDITAKPQCTLRQIEAQLRELDARYNYNAIKMDFTGLGEGIVETIQENNRRVEGVRFTLQKKQGMYNNLKREMEFENVLIPNHEDLIRELNDVEIEHTPRGKTKIVPGEGGSDDFFDSLMLAVDAKVGGSRVPPATGQYTFDSDYAEDEDEDTKSSKRAYSFGS